MLWKLRWKMIFEGFTPKKIIGSSETRGHCELKNLITNVNYEVGSSKRRTNNNGRVRSEL